MREVEIVDRLLAVVDSPPASRSAADELEAAFSKAGEALAVEDFVVALSMYEPTDEPDAHLVGFDGLRSAARDALHELGRHDRCLHDVPLAERP